MTKHLLNKGINKDIALVHCNDVKFLWKLIPSELVKDNLLNTTLL